MVDQEALKSHISKVEQQSIALMVEILRDRDVGQCKVEKKAYDCPVWAATSAAKS